MLYLWEYRGNNELLVIFWICWSSCTLLSNYATKIMDSLKNSHVNLKCLINMYFVNVKEHVYIFFLQIRPNTKSEGILNKRLHKKLLESNYISKLNFKIQNSTNDTNKLTKQIIIILGLSWEPRLSCTITSC